ncbi:sortase [Gottschalkia purinilytica]|uniref:Sortase n=1 Tax=Gottschalkia purinilytica TaxID=1503 RepID=A0A0L0W6V6_GOTPU|nr:GNAT family N-acetyltransferase [Gottschalkia purinilytica]KNF07211.1 sortase [Gottschalkia purinilytica]
MTTIERVKESELADLSRLYYQLVSKNTNINTLKKVFNKIKSNPSHYLLGVKINKKLVGTATVILCNDLTGECRPFIVVENVIIDENYRGKGYGKMLFKKIEQIANENNCHYIIVVSNKSRKISHKFYTNLGFNSKDNLAFKKYLK